MVGSVDLRTLASATLIASALGLSAPVVPIASALGPTPRESDPAGDSGDSGDSGDADKPKISEKPKIPAEIAELDRRQHRIQLAGMATLTGWSIANIVGGVAGNFATPRGDPWRYAHQMNAMWNTVNLTLGAIGLANARRRKRRIGRRLGVRADVAKTQRVFAINALLDVAYILSGTITWEIGKDRESPRLIGYGGAVIAQGAFLMLFDLAMISAHERGLRKRIPGATLAVMPTRGGASLTLGGSF